MKSLSSLFRFLPGRPVVSAVEHFRKAHESAEPTPEYLANRNLYQDLARTILQEQKNRRILDVGIGPGDIWENFTGAEITGLDSSPRYLQECKKLGVAKKLIEFDLSNPNGRLPVPNNHYRLVISLNCLWYIRDATRVIEQLFDKVAPGGSLVFNNPEPLKGPSRQGVFRAPEYNVPTFYLSRDDIFQIARTKGLKSIGILPYARGINRKTHSYLYTFPKPETHL